MRPEIEHIATHCNNTLQHTETHCNTLQQNATECTTILNSEMYPDETRNLKHCNTLQHTATHCNTQHEHSEFRYVFRWPFRVSFFRVSSFRHFRCHLFGKRDLVQKRTLSKKRFCLLWYFVSHLFVKKWFFWPKILSKKDEIFSGLIFSYWVSTCRDRAVAEVCCSWREILKEKKFS